VRPLRLAAAALVLTLAAPQARAEPSDGTVTRRTTLLVHDIDASIAFYRTLGFDKWYEGAGGTVTGQGLPVAGVKIGDPTRLVIMKGKDPYIGMIGLLQYGPKKKLPKTGQLRTGDAILMIEMRGMDEAANKMRAAGYKIQKGPVTSRIKSVDSEWDAKFMYVFDPDGHMVELTERLN
jgi:catechol 2,3-dioxygenase-like lactoylglutathione lyase family enzyme